MYARSQNPGVHMRRGVRPPYRVRGKGKAMEEMNGQYFEVVTVCAKCEERLDNVAQLGTDQGSARLARIVVYPCKRCFPECYVRGNK